MDDKLAKEYEEKLERKAKLLKRKEQCENEIKRIDSKISLEKRKADTKRKIEKGGMIESFEREITGQQELTTKDDIAKFLRVVFKSDELREKLKEITNERVKEETEEE